MGLEERFNKSVDAYKELKTERDNMNAQLDASASESEQKYNELVKKYDELSEQYESSLYVLSDSNCHSLSGKFFHYKHVS